MGGGGGTMSIKDPIPTFYNWITADRQRKRKGASSLVALAVLIKEDPDFPQDVDADTRLGFDKLETYLQRNYQGPVAKILSWLRRWWLVYVDVMRIGRLEGRYASK